MLYYNKIDIFEVLMLIRQVLQRNVYLSLLVLLEWLFRYQ